MAKSEMYSAHEVSPLHLGGHGKELEESFDWRMSLFGGGFCSLVCRSEQSSTSQLKNILWLKTAVVEERDAVGIDY